MNQHAFINHALRNKGGDRLQRRLQRSHQTGFGGGRLRVLRVDEETRAGTIRAYVSREFLFANLVVVDLSIDNPNGIVKT